MNCSKCGSELRVDTEQVGVDDKMLPVFHRFGYCDKCMLKYDLDEQFKKEQQEKNKTVQKQKQNKTPDSALSIIAFLISLFGCGILSVIGCLVAILDLVKGDKNKQHGWSVAALVIGCLWIGFSFLTSGSSEDTTTEATTQQIVTEATTEVATTQEPKITVEEIKQQAVEVTYEDIYRNPETYKEKPIKIVLYVNEYDTQFLGAVEVYYCTCDGKDVFVTDYRDIQEPTIASGDTIVLYGLGSGLATLTESQKNMIGFTTDSEKSQIPSIDMYYVELQ